MYCVTFNDEYHYLPMQKDGIQFIVDNYDVKPGDYLRIEKLKNEIESNDT